MNPAIARFVVLLGVFGAVSAADALPYIDAYRPETLGAVAVRATSITVFKVEKFSREKRVIIYAKVEDLKGKFPRDRYREFLSDGHEEFERASYLEWVAEGNLAILFKHENRQALCIGGQWTVCDFHPPKDENEVWTVGTRTEPWFLKSFSGDVNVLIQRTRDLLAGKEVVTTAMVGERDGALRKRTGEIVSLQASLRRLDYNLARDRVLEEKK